ncbi:MAG: hypothetical protein E7043_03555 [Lentisphaerae bacterium]|nr:hypothetical protein [Lentisphaerota bacterium]
MKKKAGKENIHLFTGKEVKQEKRNSLLPFLKRKQAKKTYIFFTGKEVKQEKRNSLLPFLKKKAGKENIHLFHEQLSSDSFETLAENTFRWYIMEILIFTTNRDKNGYQKYRYHRSCGSW